MAFLDFGGDGTAACGTAKKAEKRLWLVFVLRRRITPPAVEDGLRPVEQILGNDGLVFPFIHLSGVTEVAVVDGIRKHVGNKGASDKLSVFRAHSVCREKMPHFVQRNRAACVLLKNLFYKQGPLAINDDAFCAVVIPVFIHISFEIVAVVRGQVQFLNPLNDSTKRGAIVNFERSAAEQKFAGVGQRDPAGNIGKSLVFAVNQNHATELTKIFNGLQPGIAVTITSRIEDASSIAKEFRDGKRTERIAVSVDMLSTGYNCRDLLNIGLMRPIFSPTEYIQIKGRGTRRYTFKIGNTEYEKKNFFMLDFCAVAEYFEEKYDYTVPLKIPRGKKEPKPTPTYPPHTKQGEPIFEGGGVTPEPPQPQREIPTWEGVDTLVSREVHVIGPNGEKVDVMTFRGGYERDIREFVERTPELKSAVEAEDDDTVETIVNERFYHRPEMFYSPDKLVISYGVPATTPAFVYNAVGRKPLPTRDAIVSDTVDSIAARFNLRYNEQKWLDATTQLIAEDSNSLRKFMAGDMTLFTANQFRTLGGLDALSRFEGREDAFEALRQSSLVRQSLLAGSLAS